MTLISRTLGRPAIAVGLLALIASTAPGRADQATTQAWFNGLDGAERTLIASSLVWTGDLAGSTPRAFTPALYSALQRYDLRSGGDGDGVLAPDALGELYDEARRIRGLVNFHLERQRRARPVAAPSRAAKPRPQPRASQPVAYTYRNYWQAPLILP